MGILTKLTLLLAFAFTSGVAASAEDFKLSQEELAGLKPLANVSQINDKVKLVYLWASWCPDCREKLRGDLTKLSASDDKIQVITINLDRDADRGQHFVNEESLKLPVYRDDAKVFTKKLKLFSVPSWVIIKKEGDAWNVVSKSSGSDMEKINMYLKQAKGDKK